VSPCPIERRKEKIKFKKLIAQCHALIYKDVKKFIFEGRIRKALTWFIVSTFRSKQMLKNFNVVY